MIDTESEPGAWARELAMQPRRCEWCRHWRLDDPWGANDEYCNLDYHRPLKPCADYEREPGADDAR